MLRSKSVIPSLLRLGPPLLPAPFTGWQTRVIAGGVRSRVYMSTDASTSDKTRAAEQDDPRARGKSALAFGLAAFTAAAAAASYLYFRSTDSEPTTLHGQRIAKLSEQEQFIHSTLSENAAMYKFPALNHAQIHTTFVASNVPVEDRLAIRAMPGPRPQLLVSVFDGHAGWQCADVLHDWYAHYVARALDKVKHAGRAMALALDAFDADLMGLPKVVKDSMANEGLSLQQAREVLLPAMSGSVVVSAMIDPTTIHVAHAGDSRAVVGRRAANGWVALPLTKDHNADNPDEVARLKREHPGEEDSVITAEGRVIRGLNVFRSAGDGRFKWAREVREWVCAQFAEAEYKYKRDIPWSLTPPYITAQCEVAEHVMQPEDEFLVLATDGLWEHASESQVVDAIGAYLDRNPTRRHDGKQPKETSEVSGKNHAWALQDRNAAAHTIRNALGGRDSDSVAKLFKIPYPESREHRDDITVVVVFFNKALKALPAVQGAECNKIPVADPARGQMKVSVEKGLHV